MNSSSYETSNVQPATSRASIRTPTSVFFKGGGTNIKKQTNIPASNSGVELLIKQTKGCLG